MNVVLISHDLRLGAILTMALPMPEGLTVLGSAAEVPDAPEAEIDAVVLDLPADTRRDAYEVLRLRYGGRVVVPVDDARDTNGWPPDAKRRFLVRPFQIADLIAGVQEPEETSVAEQAARYRRLFRRNRHRAPAFPDLSKPATPRPTEPPEASTETEEAAEAEAAETGAEEPAEAGDREAAAAAAVAVPDEDRAPSQEDVALAAAWVRQAEESRPEGEVGRPAALAARPSTGGQPPSLQVQAGVAMAKAVAVQQWLETEEAKRSRGRRRRLMANVAAGVVLLLVGVGIGMAIDSEEPQQLSPPDSPQQVVQIRDAPPPAACTQAMDNADAVISYLVAKIRDERLSESIQDYSANARACRRTARSP
jgi:hypothetical protein